MKDMRLPIFLLIAVCALSLPACSGNKETYLHPYKVQRSREPLSHPKGKGFKKYEIEVRMSGKRPKDVVIGHYLFEKLRISMKKKESMLLLVFSPRSDRGRLDFQFTTNDQQLWKADCEDRIGYPDNRKTFTNSTEIDFVGLFCTFKNKHTKEKWKMHVKGKSPKALYGQLSSGDRVLKIVSWYDDQFVEPVPAGFHIEEGGKVVSQVQTGEDAYVWTNPDLPEAPLYLGANVAMYLSRALHRK